MSLLARPSLLLLLVALFAACRGEVFSGDFEVSGPADLEELAQYRQVDGVIRLKPGLGLEVIDLPRLEKARGFVVERDATLTTLRLGLLKVLDGKLTLGDPEWPRASLPRLASIELPSLVRVEALHVAQAPALNHVEVPSLHTATDGVMIASASLTRLAFPALVNARYLDVSSKPLTALDAPLLQNAQAILITSDVRFEPDLHQDALASVKRVNVDVSSPGEAVVSDRKVALETDGDLRQLGVGPGPDSRPLVVLGYERPGRLVFEGRDGTHGELRWATPIGGPDDPQAAERRVVASTHASVGVVVLVHIHTRMQLKSPKDQLSTMEPLDPEVVALDPNDGRILWRRAGARAWLFDNLAIVEEAGSASFYDTGRVTSVEARSGTVIETGLGPSGPAWRLLPRVFDDLLVLVFQKARDGTPYHITVLDDGRAAARFRSYEPPRIADKALAPLAIVCQTLRPEPPDDGMTRLYRPCPHFGERPSREAASAPTAEVRFVGKDTLRERAYWAVSDGRSPLRRTSDDVATFVGGDDNPLRIGPYRVDVSFSTEPEDKLQRTVEGLGGWIRLQSDDGQPVFEIAASGWPDKKWLVDTTPLAARPYDHLGIQLGALIDGPDPEKAMAWFGLVDGLPAIISAYQLRWSDGPLPVFLAAPPPLYPGDRRLGSLLGEGLHVVAYRRGETTQSIHPYWIGDERVGPEDDKAGITNKPPWWDPLERDGHILRSERFGVAIVDVHQRRLVWALDPDVVLVDITDEARKRSRLTR